MSAGSAANSFPEQDWLFACGYRPQAESKVWLRPRDTGPGFTYSDGDEVERRLLDIVRSVGDRSVLSMALRQRITDWPSRYHLSPVRANLLRPLEHLIARRSVLEIGAGCGALTRFIGECGASTIALEGSPQRAAIAAARCADLANVAVVADSLQCLADGRQFDVVTLIGVLEYARIHFRVDDEGDAIDAMLARARALLRPGGVLIVAIENQLGLKYFAGYREDHVAAPMYGVEDLYESDGVVTFGKAELGARLHRAGLARQSWMYPFPDYKLPVSILTERGVANRDRVDLAPLLGASVAADPQTPGKLGFSLQQAWRPVYRNGLAGHLANSFLVVAGDEREVDDLGRSGQLVQHFSVERRPCFVKALDISADGDGAIASSRRLVLGERESSVPLVQHLDEQRFWPGELWHSRLVGLLNRPGWNAETLARWTRVWLDHLVARAGATGTALDAATTFQGGLVDAVPRNLIVTGAGGRFFDLEWEYPEPIEAGYLLYRGIVLSLVGMAGCAVPARGQRIDIEGLFLETLRLCGLDMTRADFARFHAAEQQFQHWVHGGRWVDYEELATHRLALRGSIPD